MTQKQEFCHWGFNSSRYRIRREVLPNKVTVIDKDRSKNLYEGATHRSGLAAEKYVQRGFKYLPYKVKYSEDGLNGLIPTLRSIGDSQSYMVLKGTTSPVKRDLRYMEIAQEAIKYISWSQTRATTTWIGSHSISKDAIHALAFGIYSTKTMKKLWKKFLFLPYAQEEIGDEDKKTIARYTHDT